MYLRVLSFSKYKKIPGSDQLHYKKNTDNIGKLTLHFPSGFEAISSSVTFFDMDNL